PGVRHGRSVSRAPALALSAGRVRLRVRDARQRAHRCAARPSRCAAPAGGGRRRRRRHVRVRVAQRGVARGALLRGRSCRASWGRDRAARCEHPRQRPASRWSWRVFRARGADDRRPAVRPRRLCLPAAIDGVPSATERDPRDAPRCGLPVGEAVAAVRRYHAAVRREPGVATERLGTSFDLLAAWQDGGVFFERESLGIAMGAGERVEPGAVASALRERPEGAVAAGVIPFEGGGTLVVGDTQVRRTDPFLNARIGPPIQPVLVTGLIPADAFVDAELTMSPAPEIYAGAVGEAARRVRAGELRKVVLARTIEVAAGRAFDARRLAHRLRAVDPEAFSFIAPTDDGILVGASPEL